MVLPRIEVEVAADTKAAINSLDLLVNELGAVGQAGETAGKDVNELKQNFDRLRRSVDPLYASSKQYEAALRNITAAAKSGAVSQAEANRVLRLAEQNYLETGRAAMVMGRQVQGASFHTQT